MLTAPKMALTLPVKPEKKNRVPRVVSNELRRSQSAPALLGLFYSGQPSALQVVDLKRMVKKDSLRKREATVDYVGDEAYLPLAINRYFALDWRFKVVRKLGQGCFSAVWLCKDLMLKKYTAIKAYKGSNRMGVYALQEIAILKLISSTEREHSGCKKLVQMQESFSIITDFEENNKHICICLEVLGPSLFEVLVATGYCGFELDVVKRIIRQLLEGLSYLHDVCHVIHTDLKPANILVEKDENYIKNLVEEVNRFHELGVQLPRSYMSAIHYTQDDVNTADGSSGPITMGEVKQFQPSLPRDTFKDKFVKATLPEKKLESYYGPVFMNPKIKVKIADFGSAVMESSPNEHLISTIHYRAFEVITREKYSYPADIWSVGCIMYELLMGEYLFLPQKLHQVSSSEHLVCLITDIFGDIPPKIALRGENSGMIYNKHGNLRCKGLVQRKKNCLKTKFMEALLWSESDATACEEFLHSLLNPDQTKRATAAEALKNVWLNQ